MRPVEPTESETPERQASRRTLYFALVVLGLGIAVVTAGALTLAQTAPEGYVNSDGEQERIFGDPLNRTAIEYEIHRLVNEKRAQEGIEPIGFDPRLQRIARNHSRDMVVRGYFGHVSPDGQTVQDRYQAAGYDCERAVDGEIVRGDENVFVTYAGDVESPHSNGTVDYGHDETKIARGAVSWWLNATGQRYVTLGPYWQRHGVGVVINSENETGTRVMVTHNLC